MEALSRAAGRRRSSGIIGAGARGAAGITRGEPGQGARVETLKGLFNDLLTQVTAAGLYTEGAVGEALVRDHEEPGRAWSMEAWDAEHWKRYPLKEDL